MRIASIVLASLSLSLAIPTRLYASDLPALVQRYVAERNAGVRAARSAAVPPFSRQTGLACSACHYQFLSLTPLGREFKQNGYTLTAQQAIVEKEKANGNTLKLPPFSLVGGMLQASYSVVKTGVPGTQNGSAAFPQQLSLFVAGQLTSKIGLFSQLTYSGADGAVGIDNIDLRYANQAELGSTDLTYGFSLNNNPTVTDLWNTTPAWGWPYAASDAAPSPAAATLINGGLAQQVLGVDAYALVAGTVYAEFGIYRSALQGLASPDASSTGTISGVAPYWRLGVQHKWTTTYAMIGTFGLHARQYPEGVTGLSDGRTDVGVDAQVEQHVGHGAIVGRAAYIHESSALDASLESGASLTSNPNLSEVKVNASWYPTVRFGLTAGYFHVGGTQDSLLHAPGEVDGSATGSPTSSGFIGEFDYNPWQNTRLGLQYVAYDTFNGSKSNYDGTGRSASANNTLYLLAWVAF